MSGHTYTLEAGRSILRDGERFAYIARNRGPITNDGAYPADVDKFARDAVRAVNSHAALVTALRNIAGLAQMEDTHDTYERGAALSDILEEARAALALAGGAA